MRKFWQVVRILLVATYFWLLPSAGANGVAPRQEMPDAPYVELQTLPTVAITSEDVPVKMVIYYGGGPQSGTVSVFGECGQFGTFNSNTELEFTNIVRYPPTETTTATANFSGKSDHGAGTITCSIKPTSGKNELMELKASINGKEMSLNGKITGVPPRLFLPQILAFN